MAKHSFEFKKKVVLEYLDGKGGTLYLSNEKSAKALKMELKKIRPYSPWQNGKVERRHREDGKMLYGILLEV